MVYITSVFWLFQVLLGINPENATFRHIKALFRHRKAAEKPLPLEQGARMNRQETMIYGQTATPVCLINFLPIDTINYFVMYCINVTQDRIKHQVEK
jgi:hypothetical protein